MPLKPVFDKAPLTMLTSQPLRAGQVRVNLPALTRLYAQVENRCEPLLLEGAFRLACLVKVDAMQSPAVTAIREAAAAQREDGSFALTIEDSVYVLRAVWALYEAEARKEDLTVLLRWFQWAAKQWDDIAADEYVRAFGGSARTAGKGLPHHGHSCHAQTCPHSVRQHDELERRPDRDPDSDAREQSCFS